MNAFAVATLDAMLSERADVEAFEDAVQGITRGLEAEAAGRMKPLVLVVEEARRKHGFPDDWPA
jgi:hypothetical protein